MQTNKKAPKSKTVLKKKGSGLEYEKNRLAALKGEMDLWKRKMDQQKLAQNSTGYLTSDQLIKYTADRKIYEKQKKKVSKLEEKEKSKSSFSNYTETETDKFHRENPNFMTLHTEPMAKSNTSNTVLPKPAKKDIYSIPEKDRKMSDYITEKKTPKGNYMNRDDAAAMYNFMGFGKGKRKEVRNREIDDLAVNGLPNRQKTNVELVAKMLVDGIKIQSRDVLSEIEKIGFNPFLNKYKY